MEKILKQELPEGAYLSIPDGYETLAEVFGMAMRQAAYGKGKQRHACSEPFEKQQSMQIARRQGVGYPLGQAEKKLGEAPRLEGDARIAEILGAIVYAAMAVIYETEKK